MGTFKRLWTNLDKDEKEQLANRMETSVNYLSQVAHGHKTPGRQFIALLEVRLGRSRQELFGDFTEDAGSSPAADIALETRLRSLQEKPGIRQNIDRELLDEALAWYRSQHRQAATGREDDLMHACKEALMHSSERSREVCWVHAALAWELIH
jgi:transcriptional regulator with XRE-family HTH domain